MRKPTAILAGAAICLAGCHSPQRSDTWRKVVSTPHPAPEAGDETRVYAAELHARLLAARVPHKVVTADFEYHSEYTPYGSAQRTVVVYREREGRRNGWWLMDERLTTPIWLPDLPLDRQISFYLARPATIVNVSDFTEEHGKIVLPAGHGAPRKSGITSIQHVAPPAHPSHHEPASHASVPPPEPVKKTAKPAPKAESKIVPVEKPTAKVVEKKAPPATKPVSAPVAAVTPPPAEKKTESHWRRFFGHGSEKTAPAAEKKPAPAPAEKPVVKEAKHEEKKAAHPAEKKVVAKPVEKPIEKPAAQPVAKKPESYWRRFFGHGNEKTTPAAEKKPSEVPLENPAVKPVVKPVAKPEEKKAAKPAEKKALEKPVEKPVAKPEAKKAPEKAHEAPTAKPVAKKEDQPQKPVEKPAAKVEPKTEPKPDQKPAPKLPPKPAIKAEPSGKPAAKPELFDKSDATPQATILPEEDASSKKREPADKPKNVAPDAPKTSFFKRFFRRIFRA